MKHIMKYSYITVGGKKVKRLNKAWTPQDPKLIEAKKKEEESLSEAIYKIADKTMKQS
jgi:hypothetical protein